MIRPASDHLRLFNTNLQAIRLLQEILNMTVQRAGSAFSLRFSCLSDSFKTFHGSNSSSQPVASRPAPWRAWSLAALAALLAIVCASAPAQTLAPAWTQLSPATQPPVRFAPGLAYDAAHGQVVMFGGFGASGILNDTWLWNGANWTQANPANSPGARSNQSMVYDAAHGQVVMFGGSTSAQGSSRMNDTWLWDGTNWTQVTGLSAIPPQRSSASMVYDAATSQVLLFGGLGTSNADIGDTWVWNGTAWAQQTGLSTSPSIRDSASMVYDAALGAVVLFGGYDEGTEQNDTWMWTGTSWTQLSPAGSPAARDGASMEYDAAAGQVVMFGGQVALAGTYFSDTWTLSGNSPSNLTWTQQTYSTSPSARAVAPAAYDAARGNVVMFGGYGNSGTLGDTWTWGPPQNFGNISYCPSGGLNPPPCSNTLTLTYNFASTVTLGTPQVLTQGVSGLDFTQASGGSCTGTISAGNSCNLLVTFTPQAPGLRTGAVELFDNIGTLLTATAIYGKGEAPEIAFGPATTYALPFSASSQIFYSSQVSTVASLSNPGALTTDSAGNLYAATGTGLLKLAPPYTGTPTTLATGFVAPQGVAIDGAGNFYVADSSLGANGEVVELAPGCSSVAACATVVYAPASATHEYGVAVDGSGNVFITNSATGG